MEHLPPLILWSTGVEVSKATAVEEMYLIYQAIRPPFYQREPLGGMFLESVLEELLERARGCSWHYNYSEQLP